jgi:hypothetical protein
VVTVMWMALRSMAVLLGFGCARNLRAGARPVHPISGRSSHAPNDLPNGSLSAFATND